MIWFKNSNTLFCAPEMKQRSIRYTIFQKASSIFLMLVLAWLTVSTPFVMTTQQLAKQDKQVTDNLSVSNGEEDGSDSTSNNVDEKTPGSNSLSEEFLHEHDSSAASACKTPQEHKLENSGTYIAFHGELHAPPPNAA